MKKFIAVLLLILIVLGISACANNKSNITDETIPETIPMDEYESPTPPTAPEYDKANPAINLDAIRV